LGLPHRIDRPSSGIIILCKTSKSLTRMTKLFREKNVKKTYWIIANKKISNQQKTLIHFLKKNKRINKSFVKEKEEKGYLKSELSYKLIKEKKTNYLYEINLLTGRHHQIRAQLSFIGVSIKGDVKYGSIEANKDRSICLHARKIEFTHPIKTIKVCITAPIPKSTHWII